VGLGNSASPANCSSIERLLSRQVQIHFTSMHSTTTATARLPRPHRTRIAIGAGALFVVFIVTGLLAWRAPPPDPPRLHLPMSVSEIVIVRENGQDRVVERANADRQSPTYEVNFASRTTGTVSRTFGFNSDGSGFDGSARPKLALGLFHMKKTSQFSLFASRLDGELGSPQRNERVAEESVARWRPMIVDYLNRNRGGERRGDELESILSSPVSYDSWLCWQNACVVAAWLSAAASLIFAIGYLVARLITWQWARAPQPGQ
jgi:hypothetical protein